MSFMLSREAAAANRAAAHEAARADRVADAAEAAARPSGIGPPARYVAEQKLIALLRSKVESWDGPVSTYHICFIINMFKDYRTCLEISASYWDWDPTLQVMSWKRHSQV